MGERFMDFGDMLRFQVANEVMVEGRVVAAPLQAVGKLDRFNHAAVDVVERLAPPPDFERRVGDYGAKRGKATR